ncbi:MAG: hypothetical protein H3C62_00030 [Gemmatimonadaceae bacterium]|nr:hypothetical protein [Gemmatimonadaceae bacterium]
MRAVTTGTAAFALGIQKKDLDNILSRYPVRGFERGKQGLSRRLSLASIEQVAIAIDLSRDYSIPIPTALILAEEALGSREGVIPSPGGHLALHVDVERIRRDIQVKLTDAIEYIIPPRRGRPPVRS